MKSLDTLVENLKNSFLIERAFDAFAYENNRIDKLDKRIANIKAVIALKQKKGKISDEEYNQKEEELKKKTPGIDKNIFGATIDSNNRKIAELEKQKEHSDIGADNIEDDPKAQAERDKMFGLDDHTQKMRQITKSKGKLWKYIVDYATITGGPNINGNEGISELLKKAEDAGKPITVKQAKEILASKGNNQQKICEKYFNFLSKQVDALISAEEGKINDKDYIVQSANKKYFEHGQAIGKELKKILPEIAPDKLKWSSKETPKEHFKNAQGEDISIPMQIKSVVAGERYNAFVYEKLAPYISSLREFAVKSGIAQTKDIFSDLLSKNKTALKVRENKLSNILDKDKTSDEDFDKSFNEFRKSEKELDRSQTAKETAKDENGKFDNKKYQGERLGAQAAESKIIGGNKKFNENIGIISFGKPDFKKLVDKWIEDGQEPDNEHKIYWMSMPSIGGTTTSRTGAGKFALIYNPEKKSNFKIDNWYGFKVHKNAFIDTQKESYIIPSATELPASDPDYRKKFTEYVSKYSKYIEKMPKDLKKKVVDKIKENFGAENSVQTEEQNLIEEINFKFFNY